MFGASSKLASVMEFGFYRTVIPVPVQLSISPYKHGHCIRMTHLYRDSNSTNAQNMVRITTTLCTANSWQIHNSNIQLKYSILLK